MTDNIILNCYFSYQIMISNFKSFNYIAMRIRMILLKSIFYLSFFRLNHEKHFAVYDNIVHQLKVYSQ